MERPRFGSTRRKRNKNIISYLEDACAYCGINPDMVLSIKMGTMRIYELCAYGTVLLCDGRRIIFVTEEEYGTKISYALILNANLDESIRHLKGLGYTQDCIAKFLEISQSTVSARLKKGGKDGKTK